MNNQTTKTQNDETRYSILNQGEKLVWIYNKSNNNNSLLQLILPANYNSMSLDEKINNAKKYNMGVEEFENIICEVLSDPILTNQNYSDISSEDDYLYSDSDDDDDHIYSETSSDDDDDLFDSKSDRSDSEEMDISNDSDFCDQNESKKRKQDLIGDDDTTTNKKLKL